MSRDLTAKVLDILCSGGSGGVYGIAALLSVSAEEVRKVLSVLLAEGILRELRVSDKGSPCNYCPLAKICSRESKPSGESSVVLYELTEKGKRICSERSRR